MVHGILRGRDVPAQKSRRNIFQSGKNFLRKLAKGKAVDHGLSLVAREDSARPNKGRRPVVPINPDKIRARVEDGVKQAETDEKKLQGTLNEIDKNKTLVAIRNAEQGGHLDGRVKTLKSPVGNHAHLHPYVRKKITLLMEAAEKGESLPSRYLLTADQLASLGNRKHQENYVKLAEKVTAKSRKKLPTIDSKEVHTLKSFTDLQVSKGRRVLASKIDALVLAHETKTSFNSKDLISDKQMSLLPQGIQTAYKSIAKGLQKNGLIAA